jgi:cell division protein FtsW
VATRVTPISEARSFATRRDGRSGRISVLLLLPVVILLIIGLGELLSASSVLAIREGWDNLYYFKRQAAFAGVGLAFLVIGARIPYQFYRRAALPIFGLAVAGLLATMAIGDIRNGSQRWIQIGSVTLQPSEFAKFAVVVMLATVLSRKADHLDTFLHVLSPLLLSLGVIGALLLEEPDFGTLILVAASAFTVLLASSARIRYIVAMMLLGAAGGVFLAVNASYRLQRLTSFLDPNVDVLGVGYQAQQSLVALGTGGWFGVGLGASRARWAFLPNAHSDFIFAIIGEETGLAGALAVVALFAIVALVGVNIALRARDEFGRLLAIGLVSWLTFQALINIGGVIKVLPITGVPLPFMSAGGSAMIANLFVIGVLINIARLSGRRRSDEGAS